MWRVYKKEKTAEEIKAEEEAKEKAKEEAMVEEENKDEQESKPVEKYSYTIEQIAELPGHTETVEFCKFSPSGKFLVTGGFNNVLRVWDVEKGFTLKKAIDSIPQEDLNFV